MSFCHSRLQSRSMAQKALARLTPRFAARSMSTDWITLSNARCSPRALTSVRYRAGQRFLTSGSTSRRFGTLCVAPSMTAQRRVIFSSPDPPPQLMQQALTPALVASSHSECDQWGSTSEESRNLRSRSPRSCAGRPSRRAKAASPFRITPRRLLGPVSPQSPNPLPARSVLTWTLISIGSLTVMSPSRAGRRAVPYSFALGSLRMQQRHRRQPATAVCSMPRPQETADNQPST